MKHSPLRNVRNLVCLASACCLGSAAHLSAQTVNTGLDPYRHTYDPEHGFVPVAGGYGGLGYGGYGLGGGMTAAAGRGVAAAGRGQEAAGVGQMHLSNAQAQQAHQTAVSQYLSNVAQYQDTALETSAKKAEATQKYDDATKAKVEAQVSLYNKTLEQMSAAHRLTAEQMHVDSGVLHWPFVLRGPEYADLRLKIDQLYDARTPEDSGTDSSGFDGIQQACQQMMDLVKEQVRKGMPVNDFVTAKHFISSIEYEARFKVKPKK